MTPRILTKDGFACSVYYVRSVVVIKQGVKGRQWCGGHKFNNMYFNIL
jgi:hypothetical protein